MAHLIEALGKTLKGWKTSKVGKPKIRI